MIGPRSALFTCFPAGELIIIDKEHEGAYKSEVVPRVPQQWICGGERAQMQNASVVLGSATPSPSLEACHEPRGEYRMSRLYNRAKAEQQAGPGCGCRGSGRKS